ncbi:hypothetical protein WN51_12267 [Melipona quadrifasciata]|uniref:Uncharacterized protein n=1 Tax=Melipona quadrifasciata TaxID=166423 RepID=A0A0M9A424_9HYME|nr:hypothetical protein WN51_12267 [Melipona quadrifasciata]
MTSEREKKGRKKSGRSVPNEAHDVKCIVFEERSEISLDQHAIDLHGKKETPSTDPDTHWQTRQCDLERLDRVKRLALIIFNYYKPNTCKLMQEFLRRMDGSVFPDGLTSNDSLMNGQEETARSHLALPRQLGPACKHRILKRQKCPETFESLSISQHGRQQTTKSHRPGSVIVLQHVCPAVSGSSAQVFRERGWRWGTPAALGTTRRESFGSSKPISQCSPQKVRSVMPYNIYSSFHYSGLPSPPAAR